MLATEKGVIDHSVFYLYTASAQAQELFFYPLSTGLFTYVPGYKVARNKFDSFLVAYSMEGSGYILQNGAETPIGCGSFFMLDCYQPHCYGTHDGWKLLWLHFDGVLARKYYEVCTQYGNVLHPQNTQSCLHQLMRIFSAFHDHQKISEAVLSRHITALLTEFLVSFPSTKKQRKSTDLIEDILFYITENLNEPLSIESLAAKASLSPFYFSRLFKHETGISPHEYVLNARIDKAKFLLRTTKMPLKEIACTCGLGNACNFSSTFRRRCGCTPKDYQNSQR